MTAKYKHGLQNQSISFKDAVIDPYEYTQKDSKAFAAAALVGIGVVLGMALITGIKSCHPKPALELKTCTGCHNKFTSYFQKNGSKNPEVMANAIIHTKSPRLLASIAVVESSGNPTVRRTGYKKRHDGAFQVNGKYHGAVSYNAVEQALQSEKILLDLLEEKGDIVSALNAYGGAKTSGTYAKKILAELSKVPE